MLQVNSLSGFGGIIRRTPVFVSFGSAKAQSASGGPTNVTSMSIGATTRRNPPTSHTIRG